MVEDGIEVEIVVEDGIEVEIVVEDGIEVEIVVEIVVGIVVEIGVEIGVEGAGAVVVEVVNITININKENEMELNEMTIGELKNLQSLLHCADTPHPYVLGQAYVARTVTHYYVGRLTAVYAQELVLEECAWVADTGRWSDFLAAGTVKEVEPYPGGKVIIGRGGLIDASAWRHALLREQK